MQIAFGGGGQGNGTCQQQYGQQRKGLFHSSAFHRTHCDSPFRTDFRASPVHGGVPPGVCRGLRQGHRESSAIFASPTVYPTDSGQSATSLIHGAGYALNMSSMGRRKSFAILKARGRLGSYFSVSMAFTV